MGDANLIALGKDKLARIGLQIVEHWIECGYDLDMSEIFDMLIDTNSIEDIPGGFDSDKHEAGNHDPREGDPWYELAADVKAARKHLNAQRVVSPSEDAP